jgi:squalene-hopene/tetraprenyl-beta-curcumene cyclase
MHSSLLGALGVLALTPVLLSAQVTTPPVRKTGLLFKTEVDDLVGLLGGAARASAAAALGGDSTLATAQILTAMAKCHRRYYYPGDVPAAARSVESLIRARRPDGSFGDAVTTAWVSEALTALPLDRGHFRVEVEQAEAWLSAQGAKRVGFDASVGAVLADVRGDVFPQHLGAATAKQVEAWRRGAAWTTAEAAEALLHLVACQVANRRLDRAQDPKAAAAVAAWSPSQQKAFTWLLTQQKDGVFSVAMGGKTFPSTELSAFGLLALQSKPKAVRTADEHAAIEAGLRWLLGKQNEDGTFGDRVPNYTTCVVVGALTKWGDAAAKPALEKAQKAILGFQNMESTGFQSSDRDYGSIGYGNSQRGDLSNLHFSLEALRATGLPADHEAFQKALVFLRRTQNLKSVNDFQGKVADPDREDVVLDVRSGDDGGAVYYPGNSNSGYLVQPDGTSIPRSYGSMTYALLKSYTLAGVQGDDPRVQAAVRWIQANWTLAVNPGSDPALGEKVQYQGLFYYYMVLAQALDTAGLKTVVVPAKNAAGEPVVVDGVAQTKSVEWRQALREHLAGMQQPDGTWVNGKNERWMENLPLLCTCYALVALERCQ